MPVLLLFILLLMPDALPAQGVPLIVDAGTRVKTVEVERSRGNAVFNLESLAPLGATVKSDTRGARLTIFGTTIFFEYTSPFFVVDTEVHQLATPARKGPRGSLVSTQFFTEWLPRHFPAKVSYSEGVLKLKTETRESAKPASTTKKTASNVAANPGSAAKKTEKAAP